MISGNNGCRVDNSFLSASVFIDGSRIYDKCNFYQSDSWYAQYGVGRTAYDSSRYIRAGTVIVPEDGYIYTIFTFIAIDVIANENRLGVRGG
jgi:hypothetical protein